MGSVLADKAQLIFAMASVKPSLVLLRSDSVKDMLISIVPQMFNPDNLPVFSTPDELAIIGFQFKPQLQTVLKDFPDGSFAIVEYGKEDVALALCHPDFVEGLSSAYHGGGCLKYEHGEDYKAARRAWLARKPPVPINPSTGQPFTLDEDGYIIEAESVDDSVDDKGRPEGLAEGEVNGPVGTSQDTGKDTECGTERCVDGRELRCAMCD